MWGSLSLARRRGSRIMAAVALVALTIGGARPAEAAGELTVTATILRGSTPTNQVRRNEPITVKVTVTNTTAALATLTTVALATQAGLTGTAVVAPAPSTVAAGDSVDFMLTGLTGSMLSADSTAPGNTTVSVTATASGTVPDDTVVPADADATPDPVSATSAPAVATLVDLTVVTQLLRGGAPAVGFLAGDPVTVRAVVTSDLPEAVTVPAGGVLLATSNLGGTGSNPATTIPVGPSVTNIDIAGFTAGPASPATASAVVSGTVPDNTLKPNDPGNDPEAVTGRTATPASATVSSFTVSTQLLRGALAAPSFFVGEAVTVRVTINTSLPAQLTVPSGGVVLTTTNLSGTPSTNPLTQVAAGPRTTTFDITGLTAGPGTPATASAVVSGTLPDDTFFVDSDSNPDPISANNTPSPASVPVLSPTFTFTGSPPPPGPVPRGSTVDVTATISNPAGAPPIVAGTFLITASAKTTILGLPFVTPAVPAPLVVTNAGLNTVTVTYPVINGGETKSVTVQTQLKAGATTVDSAPDFSYTATFVSAISLPAPPTAPALNYEIRQTADVQMIVDAPASAQRDPFQVAVPVGYSVRNGGIDPAQGVKFTATRPVGAVGAPSLTGGTGWTCLADPTPATSVTCSYGPALLPGTTTPVATIAWTFDSLGTKTFSATADSSTDDSDPTNDTISDDTTIDNPTSGVTITATASPKPVVVAVDKDAIVTVTYSVRNNGPTNITSDITVAPPSGAFLQTLTASAGTCNVASETAASVTCSLGTLNKNGTPVTVTATFRAPKSTFTANQITFAASIAATNGGTFTPECPASPTPPIPGCSTTTASDSVTGTPPVIDIGLAPTAVAGDPVVNRPDNTLPPVDVTRTFTFQNFSTQFTVLAGTAFIEFTVPAAPSVVITTVGCTATGPGVFRCAVPGVVPVATGPANPGTVDLVLNLQLQTVAPVLITARALLDDPDNPDNRVVDTTAATPDSRQLTLDLNRTPSVSADSGPGIPASGTLTFLPIPQHDDDDADPLSVVDDTNICDTTPTSCVVAGGTATGLSVVAAANKLIVTFASSTPTTPGAPVTVVITYGVTDTKSTTNSTLKVKLLPAITETREGSFGKPPAPPLPQSFLTELDPERVDSSTTAIDVLKGDFGTNADGTAFTGTDTYDLTSVDQASINVVGSAACPAPTATVPACPRPASGDLPSTHSVVRYTPAPGYTSDPLSRTPTDLAKAPPDSFRYKATGTRGGVDFFTVESKATVEVRNQLPIGLDSLVQIFTASPSGVIEPAGNDIDGNRLAACDDPNSPPANCSIAVKTPAGSFVFDDEGKKDAAHGLQIACIGPVPTLDPVTGQPPVPGANVCTEPGMKIQEQELEVAAPINPDTGNSPGKIKATLVGVPGAGVTPFKTVKVSIDASVVGIVPFAAVVVDNYGGSAWSLVNIEIPNQPPEVIPGVQRVPKNSPPVKVLDTTLPGVARDNNGDLVRVSSVSDPDHGTATITSDGFGITYKPDTDYVGPDSLDLNVSDNRGVGSNSAQMSIDVFEVLTPLSAGADSGAAGAGGGSAAGSLAKTGGDPLPLTAAAGCSLVLGFGLVQASRRRRSLPLLDRARHLRA